MHATLGVDMPEIDAAAQHHLLTRTGQHARQGGHLTNDDIGPGGRPRQNEGQHAGSAPQADALGRPLQSSHKPGISRTLCRTLPLG